MESVLLDSVLLLVAAIALALDMVVRRSVLTIGAGLSGSVRVTLVLNLGGCTGVAAAVLYDVRPAHLDGLAPFGVSRHWRLAVVVCVELVIGRFWNLSRDDGESWDCMGDESQLSDLSLSLRAVTHTVKTVQCVCS